MTKQPPTKPKTPFSYESLADCERPSCDDIVTMMKKASDAAASAGLDSSSPRLPSAPAAASEGTSPLSDLKARDDDCPPSSSKLGRSTWTLLHTMVAWYPDEPNPTDRTEMQQFLGALARFYPCPWCAHDFQDNLQQKPPQTASRTELCQWLCDQHNIVNTKLGKPLFSCDMSNLDERWRKSTKDECRTNQH